MGEGVGEAGDRRLEGGEGAGGLLAVGGEVHGFFWVVVSRSYTYSVQWGQSEGWCGERRLAGGFLFGGLGMLCGCWVYEVCIIICALIVTKPFVGRIERVHNSRHGCQEKVFPRVREDWIYRVHGVPA